MKELNAKIIQRILPVPVMKTGEGDSLPIRTISSLDNGRMYVWSAGMYADVDHRSFDGEPSSFIRFLCALPEGIRNKLIDLAWQAEAAVRVIGTSEVQS
jgi:hypothetical protein